MHLAGVTPVTIIVPRGFPREKGESVADSRVSELHSLCLNNSIYFI